MRFSGFQELLTYWLDKAPDAPALIYEEGEKLISLSYRELYEEARHLAGELYRQGKNCVGIVTDGHRDGIIGIFAANMAGMQTVILDASLPVELLKQQMLATDVECLLGPPELCNSLRSALCGGAPRGVGRVLFFSSGTSEKAKAIVLNDHSLCQSAYDGSAMLPLQPSDRLLCILPISHVFGFVCSLLWGLSCGAAVLISRGRRFWTEDFAYFRPTAVSLVPAMLGFFLKYKLFNPELRLILIGAGDCPKPMLDAAKALGIELHFGYGLTETSSGVAISTGADPHAMSICPDNRITIAPDGEVLIYAPTCMMEGYYKDARLTSEVLIDGVLHTGDLGCLDDEGRLHITGRKKDILVLADGTKIFLPEYEAELAQLLPGLEIAVALIEAKPVLAYFGVTNSADIQSIIAPLMKVKPRGQRISRVIEFSSPLPRTATGKLKRWELQKILEEI